MQAKKTIEIEAIHKNNLNEDLKKSIKECDKLEQMRKKLTEELAEMKSNYERSLKDNEDLSKNMSSLGSQLA